MGYVRDKRYRLKFVSEEFKGLEVTVTPLPIGEHLELLTLLDTVPNGTTWAPSVLDLFARALVSWNLETKEGEPIPTSVEGLAQQDYEFTLSVIRSYIDTVTGVPAPLVSTSPDGEPFQEVSLPMEPLSPSLSS